VVCQPLQQSAEARLPALSHCDADAAAEDMTPHRRSKRILSIVPWLYQAVAAPGGQLKTLARLKMAVQRARSIHTAPAGLLNNVCNLWDRSPVRVKAN
jgi:hypothetical protein